MFTSVFTTTDENTIFKKEPNIAWEFHHQVVSIYVFKDNPDMWSSLLCCVDE